MEDHAKEKIIVALDVDNEKDALTLCEKLSDHVGAFKIGLELIHSTGIAIIQKIAETGGNIFLDLKFHDIPNTVAGAARAVSKLSVKMFNVHTMGGLEMMAAAVKAAEQWAPMRRPLILGVTILTSIDKQAMNHQLRISGEVEDQVVYLSCLAERAGLDGVICSPKEIESIRKNVSRNMLIVTPGVRPIWASVQDQKRISTPGEAVIKGASYLVIGRPITKPPSKIGTCVDAARLIAEEISAALEKKTQKI
ncbi:MAG: orotidine-5'-phosphate decarboxylase [Nitrospirae bacterium]|nr:orotidine-5'-phosphate decarboxylase [Nitrospirota bacterium]